MDAVRAGADGYLLKHLNAKDFLDMVNGLERGEAALTRSLTARLLKLMATLEPESERNLLSEREIEILRLVAAGKSNRLIAEQLLISENTVKYHMGEVLRRLHLKNREQVVAYAQRTGLTR